MASLELQIVEEPRTCLKCGHVRRSSGEGPDDFACPACGAIYAKLEALQKTRAQEAENLRSETRNFDRHQVSQERFEQGLAAREAAEAPRYAAAHLVYLLMVLPFVISQAFAIVLAYKMRRASDNTWLDDHCNWQIKTFWYLFGLSLLAGVTLLAGVASMSALIFTRDMAPVKWTFQSMAAFATICGLTLIVALYRIGKGWYRLSQRESP